MSKFGNSDTENSLQLSEPFTSDPQVKKKKKYRKKKSTQKHIVECYRCHESFRTKEKLDRYTCQPCQSKPALIVLPLKKTTIPSLSGLSIQEDDEDICPVCDTDCTCGTSAVQKPVIEPPKDNIVERIGVANKLKKKSKKKRGQDKMVTNFIQQRETDEDEEVIIDDLDDLLDTMSPLSDQVSDHESMQLHTDDSDNDDSIEKVMYIENDDDEEDEEDEDEEESDNSDINEEYENNIEHSIVPTNWSTTDDEEDEEEVDMFSFSGQEEVQFTNESSNTYDNIVSAFMHSLAPNDPGGAESNGTNTPILRETEKLSAFELANALSLLSSFESENQTDLLRRPSLPSSTVSAAQRHRGSQDFNSETLCNLSNIMTDDISLTYDTMHASSSSNSSQIDTPSSLNIQEQLFDFFKSNSAAVENKKRLPIINETTDNNKKRRMSLSREEPTEGITMDDLVDTSQLHSDEENNEQDHPYSRDLNRWQRIPIGAFRLMRSKNKLWLER